MIYTVRIDFDDAALRDEFATWLQNQHIGDVLTAGADDAMLKMVEDACAIEMRYTFESRAAFEAYERDHAPRLRADGIAFLAGRPARFTRSTSDE